MNPITPENLLARGYREYPGMFGEKRFFRKRFDDKYGAKYFLEFREWKHPHEPLTYDAGIAFETLTEGNIWITMQENSIQLCEEKAESLWKHFGEYYERYKGKSK